MQSKFQIRFLGILLLIAASIVTSGFYKLRIDISEQHEKDCWVNVLVFMVICSRAADPNAIDARESLLEPVLSSQ